MKTESVPGLPFYVKKAACLHTVVWLEPVYTLNVELISTPKDGSTKTTSSQLGTTSLSLSQLQAKDTQAFFHLLNNDSSSVVDVVRAWVRVATADGTPYSPSGFPEPRDRILISNASDPQLYVDYSQPYYVNVRTPLAGSAKLDNKLASDGTLTEVSAEVEEKTIETITTGIKDLASTALGAAKSSEKATAEQHVKLTIAASGYKHTLSRLDPAASFPCAVGSTDVASPYSYSRSEVSAPSEKKPDSKGSKISVSGEITLPESKPSAEDAPKEQSQAAPVAKKN